MWTWTLCCSGWHPEPEPDPHLAGAVRPDQGQLDTRLPHTVQVRRDCVCWVLWLNVTASGRRCDGTASCNDGGKGMLWCVDRIQRVATSRKACMFISVVALSVYVIVLCVREVDSNCTKLYLAACLQCACDAQDLNMSSLFKCMIYTVARV